MEFLNKILPIILMFILGYLLKRTKLFGKETADIFLKFIFYVTMPALVFKSVSTLQLSIKYAFLPIIAISVFFGIYFIAYFIGKKLKFTPQTFGTFLLGTMIMNTGFALPFIHSAYGTEGIALITIFDFSSRLQVEFVNAIRLISSTYQPEGSVLDKRIFVIVLYIFFYINLRRIILLHIPRLKIKL